MTDLSDWEWVPLNQPLSTAIDLDMTQSFRAALSDAGIATDFYPSAFERGEGWISQISRYRFQHRFIIEGPCGFYGGPYAPNAWSNAGGLCAMGACSYSHSPLPEGMRVGRYCSIGRDLRFLDFAHPTDWISSSVAFFRPQGEYPLSAVANIIDRVGHGRHANFERRGFDPKGGLPYPILGHDVWIGERVTLSMGIRIGTGAVVAAGSVVTHDVPPYAIVAGVPAQVKRLRFDERTIERLLRSRWWRYHFADLNQMDVTVPDRFLDALEDAVARGTITEWRPNAITLPDDWVELKG